MPFYLTNENIEATIERNPDDILNPSDINYKPSSRNTKIRELILQVISNTFDRIILKTVIKNDLFHSVNSLQEDKYSSYLFAFESEDEEYEIIYHLPIELASVLGQYTQNEKEVFLSLSNSIVICLNEQDFTFLQDIKFKDLSDEPVDYKNVKNLYFLRISIDKKDYKFYLQLDNQFNKIF
ncbi:hypothetical protein [Arcobacter sp. LA11]|uniref:hypothetical protein n=1 Tax=Arcobacter sp. LA11 TaxID=1898176 RepID=UPI0009323472|nr:hypothetical protein [Arcobacter sp. LA11]